MSIEAELQSELKDAMKSGDKARLDTIRQVNSEILLAKSAPGFHGQIDDELYLDVIAAQVKKDRKSIEEFSALGERGAPMVAKYEAEVDYLSRWLPSQMSEEETETIVRSTIAKLGVEDDPKAAGRVIGHIMRTHKDEVDGSLVNKVVRRVLDAN